MQDCPGLAEACPHAVWQGIIFGRDRITRKRKTGRVDVSDKNFYEPNYTKNERMVQKSSSAS